MSESRRRESRPIVCCMVVSTNANRFKHVAPIAFSLAGFRPEPGIWRTRVKLLSVDSQCGLTMSFLCPAHEALIHFLSLDFNRRRQDDNC